MTTATVRVHRTSSNATPVVVLRGDLRIRSSLFEQLVQMSWTWCKSQGDLGYSWCRPSAAVHVNYVTPIQLTLSWCPECATPVVKVTMARACNKPRLSTKGRISSSVWGRWNLPDPTQRLCCKFAEASHRHWTRYGHDGIHAAVSDFIIKNLLLLRRAHEKNDGATLTLPSVGRDSGTLVLR